jgi:hypothetical protein
MAKVGPDVRRGLGGAAGARAGGLSREEFLSLAAAAWDRLGSFTEALSRECGARGMAVRPETVRDRLHVWLVGRPGERVPGEGNVLLRVTSRTGGLPAYLCCFEDGAVLCRTPVEVGAELDRILSHPDVVRALSGTRPT